MKTARIRHAGEDRIAHVREDGLLKTADGSLLRPEEIEWLPPPHGVVIGVALNHAAHVSQLAAAFRAAPYQEPPRTPVLFIKPENTITGHAAMVQVPDGVPAVQPGPSLAVVIGRTARRVRFEDAFSLVKGYTIFNDFSLPELNYYRPPVRTKCFDSFGPLGPYVVDMEDLPDPRDVTLRTHVNGELRQEWRTRELLRSIPELIESISAFMTLHEDDVIATGFAPERTNVVAGDIVVVEVSGIGSLASRIVTEGEYYAGAGAVEAVA
ncbi:MAG: fumarylacetoacetate hydrolase family protein [Gammaproteobacteria bacterium]